MGMGFFPKKSCSRFIEAAAEHDKITAVDSRYQLDAFQGAVIATPNLEEASQVYGKELKTQAEVEEAGVEMRERLELKYLLITQGGDGMTLFAPEAKIEHIPAANFSEVFDVTGLVILLWHIDSGPGSFGSGGNSDQASKLCSRDSCS